MIAASAIVIFWLLIGGLTGPLFGNLASVEKNDNSKFLSASTESSRATDAILKFSNNTANNQFPTLLLFE